MKCTACSKDLLKKDVLYTANRLPYCSNPMTCKEEHPNSVKNIVERAGAEEMYTESQLEVNAFDRLDVDPDMKKRIMRVSSKPQSIRIPSVDQAHYILKLQEVEKMSSVAEAVRWCIDKAMAMYPIDAPMENLPVPEVEEKQWDLEPKEIEVPIVPKSINVDWDEIKRQNDAMKPELEKEAPKEEKFVF